MNYPVTIEQIKAAYEEACGDKMPDFQESAWQEFADVINGAYDAGVVAGVKKAQKAICEA